MFLVVTSLFISNFKLYTEMKRLIISILAILVGLFVIDRLGGTLMWWVNQHTRDVSGPKMRYLVNDVHEDVLMMGTSRCNCHYVPSIISDSIGMSVYNAGIDGSYNIYSHYLILNHILAIHKPKLICLEVEFIDCVKQTDAFSSISFFAPYFGLNEKADSVFRLAGKYWKYRISHLYRYNAKAVSNIGGLVINRNVGGDNGYYPCPQPPHFPELFSIDMPIVVDSMKLGYIQRFVNLCKANNIKLIFMISPMYAKIDADHYDVLKELARKNDIPLLDYHTAGLYLDHPEYFKDVNHLWDKGARLYSSVFASDIKKILNQ